MWKSIAAAALLAAAGGGSCAGPARQAEAPPPEPALERVHDVSPARLGEAEAPPAVDFATQVLPIVEACRPCHFEGGKMYEELPFDDPETIRALGARLFTRIKGEEEQALLRAFFAQGEADPPPSR